MESAEFSPATVSGRGNQLNVSHGGDDALIVQFMMEPVLQGFESEQAGRQIFKDTPFVWIRFPGDRTREVKRKANAEYRARFPRQWAAFERQQVEPQSGTPLEQWGPISRSHALTLKGVNVHTVENLAAVPDSALHNLGHGGRELRDKAITWLKTSADDAEALRLAADNKRKDDRIAALEAQVAELAQRRKPGRPRKDDDEDDAA